MTRHATPYGAFEIASMPSQPQIGICHGFFVDVSKRGQGLAHNLKQTQFDALDSGMYDYGMCTCDAANAAQQAVLKRAGWHLLDEFSNRKTGGHTQIWGSPVKHDKAPRHGI